MRPWPKALLFDLDDTLWPIAPVIARAETSLHAWLRLHAPCVAERYSVEQLRARRLEMAAADPRWRLDLGALRRAGLAEAFAACGMDAAPVEAAMRHFFAARNAVELYPDVLDGLRRLGARIRLGSISNGNADLGAIGLASHFEVSIAASELGCAKPDAAIFHAACAAMGVAPGDAVYVGDDLLLDVQGAQQAGLRAVWLRRDAATPAQADGAELGAEDGEIRPDAVCADFAQLLAWLDGAHAPAPFDGQLGGRPGERA
ncbi:MAG: HAD-IA family hydrolase [Pseudomonadota bacterium]